MENCRKQLKNRIEMFYAVFLIDLFSDYSYGFQNHGFSISGK